MASDSGATGYIRSRSVGHAAAEGCSSGALAAAVSPGSGGGGTGARAEASASAAATGAGWVGRPGLVDGWVLPST